MNTPRCALLGAFLAGAIAPVLAQSYNWSALAALPPQYGSADGAGAAARFNNPFAIAGDSAGNFYVSDFSNHTIRRLTPDGTVTTLAGVAPQAGSIDGTGANARFYNPWGLTFTGGNLYVSDYYYHVIRRVTPAGVVTTVAGRAGSSGTADGAATVARFNQPTDLVSDAVGNLYVADAGNNSIRKITPDGTVTTLAGTSGAVGSADGSGTAARFNRPTGLAIDAAGVLYVSDTYNHTIRKITTGGAVTTLAGTAGSSGSTNATGGAARFNFPGGLTVTSGGTILVADTSNHGLRQITPAGVVSLYAGRLTVEGYVDGSLVNARFFFPTAVTAASDGNLYVVDSRNLSIRKITAAGDVSTFAGPGGNFGKVDGSATTARFNYPSGVAVHSSGDVYLADSRGNSIRRIAPDGTVGRVVGNGTNNYVDGSAAVASVNYPFDLAMTADRTIYFCEQQVHAIRVLNPDGSVATIAGAQGTAGSIDGIGTAARFNFPSGIARDSDGNLFVADANNSTIRKIAAGTSVVTTFAGTPGLTGTTDGAGPAARFNFPQGLAIDANNTLYVADANNHTLRKITRAGSVTTVAGVARSSGANDGDAATARFNFPMGVAIDLAGRIFVADANNSTIRRIDQGIVSTIGGLPGNIGYAEGLGDTSRMYRPNSIAIDTAGVLYVSDSGNNVVVKGVPETLPMIVLQPLSTSITSGGDVSLVVGATGTNISYQWKFNGAAISGATSATYAIKSATSSASGAYTVEMTNSAGAVTSGTATVTVKDPPFDNGRLINLSVLTPLATDETMTMGTVLGGAGTSGAKPLVVRAVGPSLTQLGVLDVLPDPALTLNNTNVNPAMVVAVNNHWGGTAVLSDAFTQVGAFPFASATSKDSALYRSGVTALGAGSYTVQVNAATSGRGTVIAEIYDATPGAQFTAITPRLVNVSVLKQIAADGTLTVGFVIGGAKKLTVLVRAVGPTLGAAPFLIAGAMPNPQLILVNTSVTPNLTVASNTGWGGDTTLAAAMKSIGAFDLVAATSKDSVLLLSLAPGNYTAQVHPASGSAGGTAIVEVYEMP